MQILLIVFSEEVLFILEKKCLISSLMNLANIFKDFYKVTVSHQALFMKLFLFQ